MLLNRIGAEFCCLDPVRPYPKRATRIHFSRFRRWRESPLYTARPAAFHGVHLERKEDKRRSICTADELHRVSVSNSNWKLALWRYLPSPKAPLRNHPLLLLSGVATNAIGYDLSPECSFARYMSEQGFDTWTLEVRGSGLSTLGDNLVEDVECLNNLSGADSAINDRKNSASSEKAWGFKNLGASIIEGKKIFPAQVFDLQERITATLKQLDLSVKYDWDFDHHLEEDVPAAMEYIRTRCQSRDGKLLAIGHSMGGILLYAMLSRCCFDGKDSGLASVVTLASSLDYTPSRSSLKLLLPLAEPVQALNMPVFPVGPLMAAAYPLANYPPYVLSWLNSQISAQGMMDEKLLEKLVLNNFCSVPSKLLLQLSTVFQKGGLRDRSGSFFYKDHLSKSNVPVLAVAGDQDLICPPEAVYETVKLISEDLVTYKVFGEPGSPHYGHYDLVGGRLAADQLYPCITEFLTHHDMA